MSSSEIEVIPNSGENQDFVAQSSLEFVVTDVYSASAYGDLEKLRKFIEEDSSSVAIPDANGYYALQWAALNNRLHVVQYILEHGGEVNAADHILQTALHWTAVRGCVAVADILIEHGAWLEAADAKGYRVTHIAAQYGQTTFLNYLIAKYNVDFDAPDNDGRGPLHWAAFKGFPDTVRLLLFRGACLGRQDKEGCTPLHWAALKGNAEICTLLVHAGSKQELVMQDHNGFTPAHLAAQEGHHHSAFFLSKSASENNWVDKILGAHVLFCIVVSQIVLFINSVIMCMYVCVCVCVYAYMYVNYKNTTASDPTGITAGAALWGWICVSLAVGSLVLLYRCSSKDPGFISGKQANQNNEILLDPLWRGNWSQLCPTCKIIRPIRSKHCPKCKHCVEQFDHHCPWISNCVGKRNKWDFFVFIFVGSITSLSTGVFAVQRLWLMSPLLDERSSIHHVFVHNPGIVMFLVFDLIIFVGASALTAIQTSQIARNITTNEVANKGRYGYLRGPDGQFLNPYNRGCLKNCADFLILGHTYDEEVAWLPLNRIAN